MTFARALGEPVARILLISGLCLLFFTPAVIGQTGGSTTGSTPDPLSVENLPAGLESIRVGVQDDLRQALEAVATAHTETLWVGVQKQYPADDDGTYSDAQKEKFRTALAEAWVQALVKAVEKLPPELRRERLGLLDRAGAADARLSALNTALREHEAKVIEGLKTWIKDEGTVPPRLAELDPGAQDAKTKAGAILAGVTSDLSSRFAARWAVATAELVAKYREPTADQTAAALAQRAGRLQDQAEDDFYQELHKSTGFSRIVRCAYMSVQNKPSALICSPGLLVSGADIGEIVIRGLPTDRDVRVTALASEDQAAVRPFEEYKDRGGDPTAVGATTPCRPDEQVPAKLKEGASIDPFCDQITMPAGHGDSVFVSVYKDRRVAPRYGAFFGFQKSARNAFAKLRLPPEHLDGDARHRLNLALLVSGGAAQTLVCVAPEAARDGSGPQPACASIPIGYERWSVETGGFLGVSSLTDQELVTQADPDDPSKVQVLSIRDDGQYAQETGLWVSFVPRNYPGFGLGLGLVSDSDRPLSVYVGPSLRLRTFGHRGVASLNFGLALRAVDRFDGLGTCLDDPSANNCGRGFTLSGQEGDADQVLTLPETSPLLDAQQDYHTNPFIAIQLGFSFGPIPGPPDSGD